VNYTDVYILSILIGIGLILYGKRKRLKAIKYAGTAIILIDIIVPITSFIAGFVDGHASM